MPHGMTWIARGLAVLAVSAFVIGIGVSLSTDAQATPAFAQQSGKACVTCHQNPAGGGKLKKAGEDWKAGKR